MEVKPNFLCLPLLTILFVIYFILFYCTTEKDGNGILYTCTVCPIFVAIFVLGHLPAFWLAVLVVAVAGAVVVACALISEP
jgi:hypothetical protein